MENNKLFKGVWKVGKELIPASIYVSANQKGGAVRGAIPVKMPIYIIVDIITILAL